MTVQALFSLHPLFSISPTSSVIVTQLLTSECPGDWRHQQYFMDLIDCLALCRSLITRLVRVLRLLGLALPPEWSDK